MTEQADHNVNILYINHPESDYGGAFLYNGICNLVGAKHVFDFPVKYSYHGINHKYSTAAIMNGFTSPLPWMPNHHMAWTPEELESEESIRENIIKKLRSGFFSLVVVESLRTTAMSTFMSLAGDIHRAKVKIVAHEGEDFQEICNNHLGLIRPTLHLKREIPRNNAPSCDWDIAAFPFSFPDTVDTYSKFVTNKDLTINNEPGEVDAAFFCGGTWDYRLRVLEALDDATEAGLITSKLGVDRHDRFPTRPKIQTLHGWWEYLTKLCSAKMGVSVRGFGWDTCRFWEAGAVTLLVHDDPDLTIPNPYTPGQNCLIFNNTEALIDLIKHFAAPSNHAEFTAIKTACIEHTWKYHTNTARAKFMFDRLGIATPEKKGE